MINHVRVFFLVAVVTISLHVSAQTIEQWKDSVAVLSEMIADKPQSLELKMRKAECNIALGQWEYALEEYTNVLNIHPRHIGALYFRAYVNGKMQRYAFARIDYEDVLRLEPNHQGALTGLILTNVKLKNVQKAFDDANRLVSLYPDDPMVFSTRATVEEAKDMKEFAVDDVNKAINMESERLKKQKKSISIEDDLVTYVVQRYEMLKGNKKGRAKLVRSSIDILVNNGLQRSAAVSLFR